MPKPRVIMTSIVTLVMCLLVGGSLSAKLGRKSSPPPTPSTSGYKPVTVYDVARDPAKDLQDAIAEATRTNKRILLEVGGDWCVYCNIMDTTFESHPRLQKLRDDNYVTVKINYSKENPNDKFLSKYPAIPDYPHFFVLDSKGALLQSQPTHRFEHGKTYNVGKIDAFLRRSSQPPRRWLNEVD
ncbi:MAG: thioredoxin family protein [Terriglobia bacterium]